MAFYFQKILDIFVNGGEMNFKIRILKLYNLLWGEALFQIKNWINKGLKWQKSEIKLSNKVYKKTMKEFLQKIKDEEKDLHSNSTKLSELLYKFKKCESFEQIKNKNIS